MAIHLGLDMMAPPQVSACLKCADASKCANASKSLDALAHFRV